ncbi:hypothetical protein PAPYR_5988 [Paratrimastix pyriformis]|uniref:Uncharacterized protein n=1 Tax=Paratrimastix pyriformis TaxID=342808 RepID=A0ABQ8UGC8_9EUKA|nr:hypothetical protein PAPYR_5988 [Paratrimastix pyriformis]
MRMRWLLPLTGVFVIGMIILETEITKPLATHLTPWGLKHWSLSTSVAETCEMVTFWHNRERVVASFYLGFDICVATLRCLLICSCVRQSVTWLAGYRWNPDILCRTCRAISGSMLFLGRWVLPMLLIIIWGCCLVEDYALYRVLLSLFTEGDSPNLGNCFTAAAYSPGATVLKWVLRIVVTFILVFLAQLIPVLHFLCEIPHVSTTPVMSTSGGGSSLASLPPALSPPLPGDLKEVGADGEPMKWRAPGQRSRAGGVSGGVLPPGVDEHDVLRVPVYRPPQVAQVEAV